MDPNAGFRLTCRLPLCRYAAWSSLAVSELQLSAATPLWLYHRAASLPSWIEFNCLRSAAVGKAARLSIYWLDAACRLVIPLRQVALAQFNKYHHQSGNAASGKFSLKPALHFAGKVTSSSPPPQKKIGGWGGKYSATNIGQIAIHLFILEMCMRSHDGCVINNLLCFCFAVPLTNESSNRGSH